jgi:ADP-dependent NAD(P)H-hydrate dehydratase
MTFGSGGAVLEIVNELPRLTPRPPDSNKGNYGRVLVVAGSRGMSGAAVLCGTAALRGGAGLVTVAVPEEILPIVAAGNPCYLTASLPQDNEGKFSDLAEKRIHELAKLNTVVALGPGIGRSAVLNQLIPNLIRTLEIPTVLDADGLNALQGQADRLNDHAAPVILTPHPGEFARLLGCDVPTVQARRQEFAVQFAEKQKLVLVLKGHGTVVTDGHLVYQNCTGNPGMATGGTGDVLTGLIAALLGQGLEPFAAAQLGVYLHGLAGDLAQEDFGQVSLIASDLLTYLPQAFRYYGSNENSKS